MRQNETSHANCTGRINHIGLVPRYNRRMDQVSEEQNNRSVPMWEKGIPYFLL